MWCCARVAEPELREFEEAHLHPRRCTEAPIGALHPRIADRLEERNGEGNGEIGGGSEARQRKERGLKIEKRMRGKNTLSGLSFESETRSIEQWRKSP